MLNISDSSLGATTSNLSSITFSDSNSSVSNITIDDLIDKELLKIEVFSLATVFILALVGNSIVIATFLMRLYIRTGFRKNKLSRMNFYIFHLSIADIYVSLGNVLTMLLWRQNNNIFFGGDLMCRLVVYVQIVSVYYSTYVLIAMSIDRYEAICKPLIGLSWSKKKGKTYIGIAFLLAHLQGLPQIGFFSLRRIPVPNLQPPTSTCYAVFEPVWLEKAYAIYTWFMQFLIPICVIIVCYVNISISSMRGIRNETPNDLNRQNSIFEDSARRKSRAAAGNSFLHSARRNKSTPNVKSCHENKVNASLRYNKRPTISFSTTEREGQGTEVTLMRRHCSKTFNTTQKFKTIKLTLTVIILYIICSTPYFVGLIMLTILQPSDFNSKVLKYGIVLSCLLLQLNSCVNPWIYFTFTFKLDTFRKLIRNSFNTNKTHSRYSSTINSRPGSKYLNNNNNNNQNVQ